MDAPTVQLAGSKLDFQARAPSSSKSTSEMKLQRPQLVYRSQQDEIPPILLSFLVDLLQQLFHSIELDLYFEHVFLNLSDLVAS
jgi:hypothetical protein